MQPFEFVRPGSLGEALAVLSGLDGGETLVWGGGTASVLLMRQGLIAPRTVVGVGHLPELQGLGVTAAGDLWIGAGTRLRDLERSAELRRRLPALGAATSRIGNVRVRNQATLGGHLVHADPAQDLPPLLLALDARVRLAAGRGERVLPLQDFLVDTLATALEPGELLLRVEIPAAAVRRRSAYVKFTPRSRDDYATVGVAASLELAPDGTCLAARVALGGVGPTALRIPAAEAVLTGRAPDPPACREAADIAAQASSPWDDARGSAAYKRAMSRVWTERILRGLAGGTAGS